MLIGDPFVRLGYVLCAQLTVTTEGAQYEKFDLSKVQENKLNRAVNLTK